MAKLWHWPRHFGPELRIFVACYMLTQGGMRVITGASAANINIFPARMIGLAMMVAGIALLVTWRPKQRCAWSRRAAVIYATAIWLLLIAAAWPVAAWVSISGAVVFVIALIIEVGIHEC